MALRQRSDDGIATAAVEPKKRRRVDNGVAANECIKIFLAKGPDEVQLSSEFRIEPFDLNQFFGEDGKIYGYTDLKINIWISTVSFHAHADISFGSSSDVGKGITDLKSTLQDIFGDTLLEKEEFLQSFSTHCQYLSDVVSNGSVVHGDSSKVENGEHSDDGCSVIEVVRLELKNEAALLYSRFVSLVLLLVEGSTPIDVSEPRWELLLVIKKTLVPADSPIQLLGVAAVHYFFHYPESSRMRLGQILVLPPYQGQGHGRRLLESVNTIATSSDAIYDVTFEDPSEYLQNLRSCMDGLHLLTLEQTKSAIDATISTLKATNLSKRARPPRLGPPAGLTELARQYFKIYKKQVHKCWDSLIYLHLEPTDQKSMANFRACIYNRMKSDIVDGSAVDNGKRLIELPNDYGHDMTFVMTWSQTGSDADGGVEGQPGGDEKTLEKQLNELVDNQIKEIREVAEKIASIRSAA